MIALLLAAQTFMFSEITINGGASVHGRLDMGVNVITVTQFVTIPCFIETDPAISVSALATAIGIHKADYGTDAWENHPLDSIRFNVTTLKEPIHFEQAHVTNITFPNLTTGDANSGDILIRGNQLKSFSCPNLISLHNFDNQVCSALTNIDLPNAEFIEFFSQWSATALVSLSLPKLTNSFFMDFHGNTAMTTVSVPLWLPKNGGSFNFSGCALSGTAVNHILARAVANAAFVTGTINLSGGTSAAPSGQGITDKNTLIARGVTVTTN